MKTPPLKKIGVMLLWASLMITARQTAIASDDYVLFYWTRDDTGMSDLYRWQAGEGNMLVAVDVGLNAGGGVISGDWLYFSMSDADHPLDIFRLPIAGGPVEKVLAAAEFEWPIAASTDGQWVYTGHYNDELACDQVSRLNTVTLEHQLVVENCLYDVALSPDDEWLVGVTPLPDAQWSLLRIRADGSSTESLMDTQKFWLESPGWVADGTLLLAGDDQDGPAIYRILADSPTIERVAAAPAEILAGRGAHILDRAAYWSPNGEWVAVKWVGGHAHIFLQATTGGPEIIIPLSEPYLAFGGWRPDSQAVSIETNGVLYLYGLDGLRMAEISHPSETVVMGVWQFLGDGR